MPDYSFAGLRQYLDLARDPRFAIDIRNTAIFTVLFLTSCLVIGLFLAILLDQRLRGENIFRSLFLFPMAVSDRQLVAACRANTLPRELLEDWLGPGTAAEMLR